jgi:hypothetical protein
VSSCLLSIFSHCWLTLTSVRNFTYMVMGLGTKDYGCWCLHYLLTKVSFLAIHANLVIFSWLSANIHNSGLFGCVTGKITALDIGNNNITSEGSHYVAEFIKMTKSLRWLSLYMDDVGDEVVLLLLLTLVC